jgi:hypothetical protein
MNHTRVLFVCLCMLGLFAPSCRDLEEGVEQSRDWAIYRLADPTVTSDKIQNEPLTRLTLAAVPFISEGDIRVYHWKTHTVECTESTVSLLDSFALHGGSTRGVPFMVTVDKERIYVGTFWWGYSSSMPWCPYMELTYPKGVISRSIQLPNLYEGGDPRSDMRIYWALKNAGVLTEE